MATKKTKTETIIETQVEPTEVQSDNNSLNASKVEEQTTEASVELDDTIEQADITTKSAPANKKREYPSSKTEVSQKDSHALKCEQLAKRYSNAYPNETEFHVTSDYQVFLGGSKNHAQNHQRSQKSGEIITIKVK